MTRLTTPPKPRAARGADRGVAAVIEIFNQLIAAAPAGSFPEPVRLVVDDRTALQGRTGVAEGGRACACASETTVFIVRAMCDASEARMTGVLAHELAHVSLLQRGREDHTERQADAAAESLFGVSVGYDAHDVQTTDQHAQRPRPARLDRVANPDGRNERGGCVVRTNPIGHGGDPWSYGLHDTKIGDTTIVYSISDLEPDVIKISSMRTPQAKRGHGSARRAMDSFLVETDLRGFTVQLCSSPLDKKTNGAKLLRFYRNIGFVPTGKICNYVGDLWLTRPPVLLTNPSATQALAESVQDVEPAEFEEHFGEDPEEVRQQGAVRHGRKVVWVGYEGKMVEVDKNYVVPIQGNQFNMDKLAAVAEATRSQSAPSQSGKPVLFVGYGTVQIIDAVTVREGVGNEDDEVPLERPLDSSDIGKLLYTIRDGNHRTFGALIGGETKVWMNLEANQLQDVEQWRAFKGVPSKKMPAYLLKDKKHQKLMKLLDAKLRDD